MLKHLKKLANFRSLVIYFVVHAVIIVAVLFSVIRLILPHIKGNLPQIEKLASESFGVEIHVDNMDTGWRGFEPALRFEGVTLLNAQTHLPLAQIHYFDVQLDLFESIRHFKLIPGRLTLDGVTLSLEQEEGGGFRLKNHLQASERSILETLGTVLTRFKRLDLKNGSVELVMREGNPIFLHLNYLSFFPRDEKYRFEMQLSGTQLPARIKMIADIDGKLDALDQSKVDGYIELNHVSYDARFMPLKFYSINPQSGNLDMDAWFKWESGRWQELTGNISLHQVMLQNAKHIEVIQPMSLDAHIAWQQLGGDFWRLTGDNIALQLGNEGSPTASFILEGGSFEPWHFKLSAIAVDDIIDMLTLSDQIDAKTREAFHHLNARGEIHHLFWEGTPTPEGFKDWHLGFKLDELHWQSYEAIPALNHISGELKLGEHQGQLTLDSSNVELILPSLYELPLNLQSLHGTVSWTNDKQWIIHSDQLALVTSDAELDATLTLIVPEDVSAATLDLQAKTGEFSHETAKKYLPTKLLPANLVTWINQSVETGRVASMETVIRGPLNRFPFKKGEGIYDMRFVLDEVDLHFNPNWPTLHHLSGVLSIGGTGLQATIDSGSIYGSSLQPSTVEMRFTKAPEPLILKLNGTMKGAAHDAESFLRASPLWAKLGSIFEMVEIRGPLLLNIKTDIPLRGGGDHFKINGIATLNNGTVNVKQWKLALNDVKGDLEFTQHSVKTAGIQGTFLDKPGILTANTETKNGFNEITWNFHSTLTKSLVEKFAKSDFWNYFDGQSEYDARFKVYIPKKQEPFSLTIQSSLKGMTLNLPAPLKKSPDQSLPSSVTLTFLTPDSMQTEFTFGHYLNGLVKFMKSTTGMSLSQAQLVAGAEKSTLPLPQSGIMLTGNIAHLAVQDWIDFFTSHQKRFPLNSTAKQPLFVISDLKADDLQYKDWHVSKARVNAQRLPEYWTIDLNSHEIEGILEFPHKPEQSAMNFNLARCAWPLGTESKNDSKLMPKDVYALNLRCKQFNYKKTDIGQFELGIHPHRDSNSVTFEPISLVSAKDKLSAKGEWATKNGVLYSHFKGETTSEDIGASLRGWGIPTDVQDAKGNGSFDLNWPGSPKEFSVKNLGGELDLRMQNGRFIGVNPGFGRMLGLLSFQGLQRRLRLDFSDVFKSGFAFDTFKTNITINNGIARTENGAMKAPAADLTFTGRTGLVKHDLDFDMIVQAHLDSTIPAAAVAIANPAAGAAVWIADKMFNPLSNVSKYRYHITGTWEKPEFTDRTQEYRDELSGPAKVKEAK